MKETFLDVSMDNLMLLTVYFFFDALGMKKEKWFWGFCLFVPNRDSIIFVPAEMYHTSYIRLKAACHPVISAFPEPLFHRSIICFSN